MNNFYIYIYLDPRKKGNYNYGSYKFEYEPFYVGKGKIKYNEKGNVLYDRCEIICGRNPHFINKINKIKENGLEPIAVKIKENMIEGDSFLLEIELIKLIGRNDLGEGTLINFTDGGEGGSGHVVSEKTRKLLRENHADFKGEHNPNYGKHTSEKTRKLISENHVGMSGKHHSEETKKLMRETRKEKFKNGELNYKGENSPRAILTEQDVIQIRLLCDEGILTQKEIGEKFGVDNTTISDIKLRKTWKHIK